MIRSEDLEDRAEPIAPRDHVSPRELASFWNVHVRTVYRDIDKGALPARRLPGGRLRIRTVDARAYGRPVE